MWTGFLKLLWFAHRYVCVCVCVCVCMCPPPRALITSGVIWCDIGHVRLFKQVSRLFPAFNYLIWHLLLIKWMDVAILTQHIMNVCQRKLRWHGTSYKRTTGKTALHLKKWVGECVAMHLKEGKPTASQSQFRLKTTFYYY